MKCLFMEIHMRANRILYSWKDSDAYVTVNCIGMLRRLTRVILFLNYNFNYVTLFTLYLYSGDSASVILDLLYPLVKSVSKSRSLNI